MMNPPTIAIAVILPFHILLSYCLILRTSLGVNGAAIAISITNWAFGFFLVGWICCSRARECWGGWSRSCLSGTVSFIKIWAPTTFVRPRDSSQCQEPTLIDPAQTLLTEWASFEIVALLAGLLGEVSIAAQAGLESVGGFLVVSPEVCSLSWSLSLIWYPRADDAARHIPRVHGKDR